MKRLTLPASVRDLLANKGGLLVAGGWVVGSFVGLQILRLGNSIGLAHLLRPEVLGMMALINTLRTGGELLTDVGIGQSLVKDRDGEKPYFFNTAWTLQIIRGGLLYLLALIAVVPLARLYEEPLLLSVLPVAALIFVIMGFYSPGMFLLQKRIDARRLALIRMTCATISTIVHLGLAWYLQSIWALVFALLISAVIEIAILFFSVDWRMHRLRLDRGAVRRILGFGKWIFLSTLVYFLASNFDRLYLADAVSFAALGVYGIARTFADTATALTQYLSSQILFPKIAGVDMRGNALRQAVLPGRRMVVWVIAVGMAGGIAVADSFIRLAYDSRYYEAAFYLPVLLAGGWFAMLATFSESILMGIGKPSNVAAGNFAKFAAILLLVPPVLSRYGLAAAVVAFAAVEVVRYLVLAFRQQAHGLSFWRQDIAATLGFVAMAIILRELTGVLGLTTGLSGWMDLAGTALRH